MDEFEWYQCDIIKKDGKKDFWCRLIAKSEADAKERLQKVLRGALTGSLKNMCYNAIARRYISEYKVKKVPKQVLWRYDFAKQAEVDLFYGCVRG